MAGPSKDRSWRDWGTLKSIALVICFAVLLTVVIPGLLAMWRGVTHREDVLERIGSEDERVKEMYRTWLESRKSCEATIHDIDAKIANGLERSLPSNAAETKRLVEDREACERVLKQKPPVYVAGFLEHRAVLLWLLHFVFLGYLATTYRPRLRGAEWWWVVLGGLGLLAVADGVLIASGLVLTTDFDRGRMVFTYRNQYIDPVSWVWDEFKEFLSCAALVYVWIVAWRHHRITGGATGGDREPEKVPGALSQLTKGSEEASRAFGEWQQSSLILAAAFLPWTYYDWAFLEDASPMQKIGPAVYLAIFDHLKWIGTWALISYGVIAAMRRWRECKHALRSALMKASSSGNLDEKSLKIAEGALEDSPASNLQLVGASLAAAASVLVPIIGSAG